jgi:hypothetical protein
MKQASLIGASLLVALIFLSSCSSLRSGNAVQAAFETGSDGWVTKHVPGAKTLSNLIPPPNEARTNWDRWYEKRSQPSKRGEGQSGPF